MTRGQKNIESKVPMIFVIPAKAGIYPLDFYGFPPQPAPREGGGGNDEKRINQRSLESSGCHFLSP
jgi:hypothetical protein